MEIHEPFDTHTQELYEIFTGNRLCLVNFLKEHGDYATLINIFRQFHKKRMMGIFNLSVLKELMLGELGTESNKQEAIYELPTRELLFLIHTISRLCGIEKICEHTAGMGLVSRMLEESGASIPIEATDGYRWIQTLGKKRFFNVTDKLLMQEILDGPNIFQGNILDLFVWPCPTILKEFSDYLRYCAPKYIIIIGEMRMYKPMISEIFEKGGYKVQEFAVQQISFRDCITSTCTLNKSSVFFATKAETIISADEIKQFASEFFKINLEIKDVYENTDENVLLEMKEYGYIHPIILEQEESTKKELIIKNAKLMENNFYGCPSFLKNIQEIHFWFTHILSKTNRLPKRCYTKEKFYEYYELVNKINLLNLSDLYLEYIVPEYILTTENALNFIWLDFHTDITNKRWKESLSAMSIEYNKLRYN